MSRNRRRKATPAEESGAKRSKPVDFDVQIASDDEDDQVEPSLESSSDEEEEDLATRKVRLAKEYLARIEKEGSSSGSGEESDEDDEGEDDDDDDDGDDRTGRLLQRARQKREGTFEEDLADKIQGRVDLLSQQVPSAASDSSAADAQAEAWVQAGHVQLLRGHDLALTSVALQSDGSRALSASKDHSVLLWDVERATRLATICPRWRKKNKKQPKDHRTGGQVLAVACSDDGRYAATGSRDSIVRIFDIRSSESSSLVQEFKGHKGAVTSLAFRTNSTQLFSASEDRCIRHYNLQEMMYMETLYGHQFGVSAIDCHYKERPVSVGRDRTARAWKLAEDAHLIYRGGSRIQAAESISMIKDDWFLTGHEDGNMSLWYTEKKRSVAVEAAAHGRTPEGLGRSVVSVRALYGSDFAASGSNDGYLRLWKIRTGQTISERGLTAVSQIPLSGYLNSIALGPKGRFAVVATGQEHRLGRWNPIKHAKNRLAIVQLYASETDGSPDEADMEESAGEKEASGSGDSSSEE
jgi:ribosomal RNA-processing protein 9